MENFSILFLLVIIHFYGAFTISNDEEVLTKFSRKTEDNVNSTESPEISLEDNVNSTESPEFVLEDNVNSTEAPKILAAVYVNSAESPEILLENYLENCYQTPEKLPRDCSQIDNKTSGVYEIWPKYLKKKLRVYCDMETSEGGWTVIQRRDEFGGPHEDFAKTWEEYRAGFGDVEEEFWLGNDALFAMSSEKQHRLRIEVESFQGDKRYAEYPYLIIDGPTNKFAIFFGQYNGDAGDSLNEHKYMKFSTVDQDFDWNRDLNCAGVSGGGWWYKSCKTGGNLNGMYLGQKRDLKSEGIHWATFQDLTKPLKAAEMKIRPVSYTGKKKQNG